jgi:hypothetical protein
VNERGGLTRGRALVCFLRHARTVGRVHPIFCDMHGWSVMVQFIPCSSLIFGKSFSKNRKFTDSPPCCDTQSVGLTDRQYSSVRFWRFCCYLQTVRFSVTNSPPSPTDAVGDILTDGPSLAGRFACPLLLGEVCFRFATCLDLFLGLVGLL